MLKFSSKLIILSAALILFFNVNIYANDELPPKNDLNALTEQFEILQNYIDVTSLNRTSDNFHGITLLGGPDEYNPVILVGVSDINDENLINEILSLPGINSDLLEIGEFNITWYGFATELPENYNTEPFTTSLQMSQIIELAGNFATLGPSD